MRTYCIEEVTTYYVKARSARAAERLFLNSITLGPGIACEVHEREVYKDPENRDLNIPEQKEG
jgi:hypothetical protein